MAKIDTWIDLANLYYQAGALDKAISAYQKIIKQGCRFGNVYNNLATAYASQGNAREAIPHFQKCIELLADPRERAVVSTHLGECHRQLGEYDSAIAAFKKAFEIDPSNPSVLKGLADVQTDLENQPQLDEQDDGADNLGEMQNSLTPAANQPAESSLSALHIPAAGGEHPFAMEMTASVNLPSSQEQDQAAQSTLLLTIGIMHWRNGNLGEADRILKSAIDLCVKIQNNWLQALCWHALALVKTDLGNLEMAIGAYRQALSLAPDRIFPWCNIGNLYSSMGCKDEAMLAFQRAIKNNPEDTASWDGLGDIYTKLGRLDDGIAAYQLGNIFEKRPQGEDAIKAYEKAFRLYKFTINDSSVGGEPSSAEMSASQAATPEMQEADAPAKPNFLWFFEGSDGQTIQTDAGLTDVIPAQPEPSAEMSASPVLVDTQVEVEAAPAVVSADPLPIVAAPSLADTQPIIIEWNGLDDEPQSAPSPAPVEEPTRTAQIAPVLEAASAHGSLFSAKPGLATARPNDPDQVASSAIASYLKVVEINPENDRAWDSLGSLYRITLRISDAIYAFEKAVSIAPGRYQYRYQLGTSYAADGNYTAAIAEIRKALELYPAFVIGHCTLASYLRKTGQQEEADEHIALAAPLMVSQKEYDRACFESIRGNISEALDLLKIALEKKQTTAEWIRRDLDLDFIRKDPRFENLAADFSQSAIEFEKEKSR